MIQAPKPYPEYKNSGLPWLGRIPVHWEVRRNGRIFAQRVETGLPNLPILEVSLKTGIQVRNLENSDRKQIMGNREQYKCATQGDIAYNMMRMWQGAVGVAPVDGLVSPAYVVARPFPETESRYYSYLFRTAFYANEVNKYSHGIVVDRNRLYWDEFKQMPSTFPPKNEQQTIANFLDSYSHMARHFIKEKRKLIKLLEEYKQVIIHRAVTRGLDPTVPLKPSGVEWLGDVPEHWEVQKFRHLVLPVAGIQMGPFGSSLTQLQVFDTGFKLFGQENTISGDFQRGSRWLTEPQFIKLQRYEIRKGDLVLTRKGSIGKCRMVPHDAPVGIADSDTIRVRISEEKCRGDSR